MQFINTLLSIFMETFEHFGSRLLLRVGFYNMRVTYIYHSCYLIEFGSFSVIFDYYKDAIREDGTIGSTITSSERRRTLRVVTHSHSDHFNPEILT